MEDVDKLRLQVTPIFFWIVNRNDISRQIIFPEPESYELFESLYTGGPSRFVVVAVESEANCEIPAYPYTTQQSSEYGRDDQRYKCPP